MLTFKASLSDYTTVKKINSNCGCYITNHPVAMTELNPFSASDKCTMKKIPYIWGTKGCNAHFIANDFELTGSSSYDNVNSRYFILTTQTEDFDKLKPTKVLGVAQTTNLSSNETRIDNMQVNPFYVFDNPYSKIFNVGLTMLNSITNKIFAKNEITLYSPIKLISYFEKIGFKIAGDMNYGDVLMKLKR